MPSCTEILTRKPLNLAVATTPSHELKLIESPIPEPGPGQCLVHVRATGICGSDVHFWKEGKIGTSIITQDCGLGHESAGMVVKVGEGVDSPCVGELSPILPLC